MACSVHWRPLHLHPYYEQQFQLASGRLARRVRGVEASRQPAAFLAMRRDEIESVVNAVRTSCARSASRPAPRGDIRAASGTRVPE